MTKISFTQKTYFPEITLIAGDPKNCYSSGFIATDNE
jgi:hypothetical protein